MDRRGFFKIVGAVTAAAAVPASVTTLIEVSAPTPVGMASLGLMREFFAYDITRDLELVRYDILTKDKMLQLSVDMVMTPAEASDQKVRASNRQIAKAVIEQEMSKRGLSWADIVPMPLPHGYKAPVRSAHG